MPKIPAPTIRYTPRGPILRFDGKWKTEYFDLIHKHQVKGIHLAFHLNEYETDFGFLAEIPHLQYIGIGVAFPFNPAPLYCLKDLRFLWMMSTRTMEIDFTRFKYLEVAAFPWVRGMDSIFKCHTLRRLALDGYKSKCSEAFCGLTNLEALDIGDSTLVEISALANLTKLKKLRLMFLPRLETIAPLRLCETLEVLHLGRCGKVVDFCTISHLKRLQHLILTPGKPMQSLDIVRALQNLRLFNFDCEVLDGNMEILKELPRLASTTFPDRRRYSHSLVEIQQWLLRNGRKLPVGEENYGNNFGYGIDNWVFTGSGEA